MMEYLAEQKSIVVNAVSREMANCAMSCFIRASIGLFWRYLAYNTSSVVQQQCKKILAREILESWTSLWWFILHKVKLFLGHLIPLFKWFYCCHSQSMPWRLPEKLEEIEFRSLLRGILFSSICQDNKVEHLQPVGLLQPLPVQHHIWSNIPLHFVKGLSPSWGKNVLLSHTHIYSNYCILFHCPILIS